MYRTTVVCSDPYPDNGGGDARHTWPDSIPARNEPKVGSEPPEFTLTGVNTLGWFTDHSPELGSHITAIK